MSRIIMSTASTIKVDNVVFIACSTTENGGAISQDCSGSKLYVSHSFFMSCKANDYSGGICSKASDETSISYSCFLKNEAFNAPSFILFATFYQLKVSSVKYSSDVSIPAQHGPGFGGITSTTYSFFNESHFKTTIRHYLFCILCQSNSLITMNRFILYNNTATISLFGLYYPTLKITNSQIISCTTYNISSFYGSSSVKSVMRNCIIKNCAITSNGENELYDCQVDKTFSGYSGKSTIVSFVLLNVNLCANNNKECSCRIRNRVKSYVCLLFIAIIG